MSKTIWKYTLEQDTTIELPYNSQVLSIQFQHGDFRLWALVDPNNRTSNRRFLILPTGASIQDDVASTLRHIETVQMAHGQIVFHAFEVIKP